MTRDPDSKLRAAKDSLVSSLFEMSKAANDTASSIVDFYNFAIENEDDKSEAMNSLTEALHTLATSMQQFGGLSQGLLDEKEEIALLPLKATTATGRKRAEKDPYAPKKPLTVFFAYSAYIRQALREERERNGLAPLSSTEITQEISKKWKTLSDDEKEKWKQAYNVELENYLKEKEKYLEAKKNGTLPASLTGADSAPKDENHAPVPLPLELQDQTHDDIDAASVVDSLNGSRDQLKSSTNGETSSKSEKRSRDGDHSGEKKKKKKKKDKKKDKQQQS